MYICFRHFYITLNPNNLKMLPYKRLYFRIVITTPAENYLWWLFLEAEILLLAVESDE